MEETEAVDLARLAPPPHRGRTGGGLNPPRGVTAARPSFIICGLRQGLEEERRVVTTPAESRKAHLLHAGQRGRGGGPLHVE